MLTINDTKYLETEDIAKQLNIHIDTARRYIRDKQIKGVKIGKKFLVKETDFKDFIKNFYN